MVLNWHGKDVAVSRSGYIECSCPMFFSAADELGYRPGVSINNIYVRK